MDERMATVQQTIVSSSTPSEVFQELPWERRREVFFSLPETARERLIGDLEPTQLRAFVRRLDPDEATDALGYATEEIRETVLADLDSDRREKIDYLLSFNPESAAGLMDLDYVTIGAKAHVSDVAERVQRFEERTGRVPTILITEDGNLLGELPGVTLSLADGDVGAITDHVQEVPQVRYDRDDSEVLALLLGFRLEPRESGVTR
ncbi:MAG: magnesium transporter MgtE N-terminal domain-containing protein, partial [Halobacteriales archaeon]